MYRWKNAVLPTNPQNQSEININCQFAVNRKGQNIVIGDDSGAGDNSRIILMSTPDLIKAASRASRGCADATFDSTALYS